MSAGDIAPASKSAAGGLAAPDGAARRRPAARAARRHAPPYRARPEGMAGLRRFFERFWVDRLERLKLAAELEQQRRNKRDKRTDTGRGGRGDSDRRKP